MHLILLDFKGILWNTIDPGCRVHTFKSWQQGSNDIITIINIILINKNDRKRYVFLMTTSEKKMVNMESSLHYMYELLLIMIQRPENTHFSALVFAF